MSIEIFEGRRAQDYDRNIRTLIPGYEGLQDLMAMLLVSSVEQKAAKVLVAGCGTGAEMQYISAINPACKLTGVDPSPEMIAQAKQKLGQLKVPCELITGQVAGLPPDNRYDAATLVLVLHFIPDDGSKLALLQSIAERLEKNAPFVLVDISGDQIKENMLLLEQSLISKNIQQEVVEKMMQHIRNDIHYCSEARMLELLVLSGFREATRFYQTLIYSGWMAIRN